MYMLIILCCIIKFYGISYGAWLKLYVPVSKFLNYTYSNFVTSNCTILVLVPWSIKFVLLPGYFCPEFCPVFWKIIGRNTSNTIY